MPYDSNGNYTLPAIYQAKAGTVIMTEQHNTPFEDVQAALNKAFLRDGSAPLLANMKMADFRITGLGNGVDANDAVTVSQLKSLLAGTALTGTTTAEALSVSGAAAFSGTITVPTVTDWTSKQAVGAKDADARYVQGTPAGGNLPVLNIQLVNASSADNANAYFQFLTAWGALAVPTNANVSNQIRSYAQPIGNYAQSQALTDTAAYLQSQINNKQPTGVYVTTSPTTSGSGGDLKINSVNFGNSVNAPYLSGYKPDGSLTSYILAQLGDLPLDRSKKLQCFQVVIQSGQRVNFPSGFSASPDSINLTATQRLDLWYTNQDAGGFTINSNSSAAQTISVNASGNR